MSILDRLDEIQARADAATGGPWWGSMLGTHVEVFAGEGSGSDPMIASELRPGDAEFIAAARADVPRLVAALRAVLDLHRPVEVEPSDTICGDCSFQLPNGRYFGKVEEWPCPTVRAVEAALGEVAS